MSIYTESGIRINLTNYPHLRLKNCQVYEKDLSVFYFKEVDFIWWNPNENCLYLSDFKDFADVQSAGRIEKVIPNLIDKSIHVLGLISSVWLQMEGSQEIAGFFREHLPEDALIKVELKIIHIINCPPIFDMHFSAVNSKFMERFGAYHKLYDIETSLVLPIGKAREFLDVFE